MLAIVLLPFIIAAPASSSPKGDPNAQAEIYAAAGEGHLERAATPGERQLDEFEEAHKNFDLAYLTADDARHLCRALFAAEVALSTADFAEDQARLSWEEVRRDDLDRLRKNAAETRRSNCRFDAKGEPQRPRLAVMDDAEFSLMSPPASSRSSHGDALQSDQAGPTPMQRRRWNAQTAAGAVFTGAGVGLVGVLAGVIGLQVRQAEAMRDIFDNARATGSLSDVDRGRADAIKADGIQTRNVAIGVGVAGAVSLVTGVALLATRTKAMRPVALLPYGGLLGGGAMLRMRF
jgi:hypothetical protein